MMSNSIQPKRVLEYWDQCTDLYLQYMTTFQAGLFAPTDTQDPFLDNATEIGKRANIQSGQRVLDLGCGVCGPVIEIARQHPEASFVCVTNCSKQVDVARERVVSFGLQHRIEVVLLDYHNIAILEGQFDRCLFLESFGYTLVPARLLESVFKKLLPGGQLYIKDICHKWDLSDLEIRELSEFNETYCYNTPALRHVQKNAEVAGFDIEKSEIITSKMYRNHSRSSMFVDPEHSNELTDFGLRHFKGFKSLPVEFYDLLATNPE